MTPDSPPSNQTAAPAKPPQPSDWGEQWKKRIDNHPARIALWIFVAGMSTGGAGVHWYHKTFAVPAATAATAPIVCRQREFRIPAAQWNTGTGIEHECGGVRFSAAVSTGADENKRPVRDVTIRAERDGSLISECLVRCDEGMLTGQIFDMCTLVDGVRNLDCRRADVTTFVWTPPLL